MIRTAAFLVCGAMVTLAQSPPGVMSGRLEDRIAIDRAIDSLNEPSRLTDAFARTGDAPTQYAALRASTPARGFRILGPLASNAPSMTISDEPWGEADLWLTDIFWPQMIVFTGANVARSEGACLYEGSDGMPRRKPLLFELKREAGMWKVASLRVLAR